MTDDPVKREAKLRELTQVPPDVEVQFVGDKFVLLRKPGKRAFTVNLLGRPEAIVRSVKEWAGA